jgi:hypothetical protein
LNDPCFSLFAVAVALREIALAMKTSACSASKRAVSAVNIQRGKYSSSFLPVMPEFKLDRSGIARKGLSGQAASLDRRSDAGVLGFQSYQWSGWYK